MKAIAYLRVSTEEQAKEGISLDNQRERIRSYAAYKGIEIVKEIEDAGISGGKNKSREGFMDLFERIPKGGVDAIILYSLDRLSRDMLTMLALEKLLDLYSLKLHTVEGTVDTSTPDGWLSFAMKALLSEHEARQVRYRTKRALQHKKSKGEVAGHVGYGFKRVGDKLKPIKKEQAVIDLANQMYQSGSRLVDITAHLNAKNILTRSGKPWKPQQTKRLLNGYKTTFNKGINHLATAIKAFITAVA
ncbi:recombinase family protein [Thermodesulfobacteriota bacterium]